MQWYDKEINVEVCDERKDCPQNESGDGGEDEEDCDHQEGIKHHKFRGTQFEVDQTLLQGPLHQKFYQSLTGASQMLQKAWIPVLDPTLSTLDLTMLTLVPHLLLSGPANLRCKQLYDNILAEQLQETSLD